MMPVGDIQGTPHDALWLVMLPKLTRTLTRIPERWRIISRKSGPWLHHVERDRQTEKQRERDGGGEKRYFNFFIQNIHPFVMSMIEFMRCLKWKVMEKWKVMDPDSRGNDAGVHTRFLTQRYLRI